MGEEMGEEPTQHGGKWGRNTDHGGRYERLVVYPTLLEGLGKLYTVEGESRETLQYLGRNEVKI